MKKNMNTIALAMMSGKGETGVDAKVFAIKNAERIFYGCDEFVRAEETRRDIDLGYATKSPRNVAEAAKLLASIWPYGHYSDCDDEDAFERDAYCMLGIDFLNGKTAKIGEIYYVTIPVNMKMEVPAPFEGFSAQERLSIYQRATHAEHCVMKAIPVKY